MAELNKFSNETDYKADEKFNRLFLLFHTGTKVKRKLLDWHLSEKKLNLLDWLTSLSKQFLQFVDVKRALRKSETIQSTDLVLNTIDIVLKNNCFDMFWDCCLLNTSFENIISSHKELLYSRYDNLDKQHESRILTKDQLDTLFKCVENSVTDEVGNEQCTYPSKRIIASLDSELNFFILSVICPLFISVNAVSECQSQISKIAVLKNEVDDDKFTALWNKMEENIDYISSYCKASEYFKRKFTKIKKAKYNRTLAQQNRKDILEEAFNNPDFVSDKVFCNLVRKELDLMTNEENLNLAKIFSGGNIHVQLTDGKCRKGAYASGVIDNAENNLEFLHSLSSSLDTEENQEVVVEKAEIDDNQNKLLKSNHLKLVQLITEIARDVLADVLKERIPSGSFGVTFNGMKTKILPLLDNHGCQLLYPDNSNYKGDLSDMDITLLYIILRNLSTIGPHTNEWGNRPNDDDRCLSANIDRIRIAKNMFVSHRSKHLLNTEDFWKVWKDIRQCIIEIATPLTSCTDYSDRIDHLLASEIDPMAEIQLFNAYKRETNGQIRLERKLMCLQEGINDIKRHLHITNQQSMDNAPNRKDSIGNIPLELRIDGDDVPSVQEINERHPTVTTHEMHINFVKKGSIIIGLNVQHSAFSDVGHFIELIDSFLSGLLQRHIQNRNKNSSYVIVSLDFLDRNNEPLTFYKPQVQFMEDKGYYLENDEATEFDEKLNVVAIHECTTEDIHKHLENAITEIFNQRQHAYLQGSASNIPSKVLQMKEQATNTTFNLDKSSVKIRPDNEDEEQEEIETTFRSGLQRYLLKETDLRHHIPLSMACGIGEQSDPYLYWESIRKASCEFKRAVPVLLDFIETLNFTGSPEQLRNIFKLVLEHLSNAEQHVITGKKQIEGVVCEHLTRRKQLEDDIKKKDKDLEEKRCQMERKQKEFKEKQAQVDGAHRKYQEEQDNYIAQLRKSENTKFGSVLANTACAGVGALFTMATGGIGAVVAVGCQSAVATGSLVAIHETGKERDWAKYYWDRCQYELHEHQKEINELQKQLENLQTSYDTSVKEKTRVDENYDKVLKQLKDIAHFFESVLKCRHFISIANGKIEILEESRKDFRFQNHLRLPLVEISEHLTSTFGLKLFLDSDMLQLCSNLKTKVSILPKAFSEEQHDEQEDIDDYI